MFYPVIMHAAGRGDTDHQPTMTRFLPRILTASPDHAQAQTCSFFMHTGVQSRASADNVCRASSDWGRLRSCCMSTGLMAAGCACASWLCMLWQAQPTQAFGWLLSIGRSPELAGGIRSKAAHALSWGKTLTGEHQRAASALEAFQPGQGTQEQWVLPSANLLKVVLHIRDAPL